MNHRDRRRRFAVEPLEMRLALSGSAPANVIGTSTAAVSRPHEVSTDFRAGGSTEHHPAEARHDLRPFRATDLRKPTSASDPRGEGEDGKALPLKHGRSFRPGTSDQTVAFTKDSTAGSLSMDVTGRIQSTGSYQAQTTLVGDVNGDGKVNLADLQAFAPSYMSRLGDPNYNPAADFNHNGVINLYDAKALLHNMTPLTPRLPLTARLTLAPQDQIHYSGPTVSGAATFQRVGHDTRPYDSGKPGDYGQ